jgi:hypothetical protein
MHRHLAISGDALRTIHWLVVAGLPLLLGKFRAQALSFRPERVDTFGHPSMIPATGFDTAISAGHENRRATLEPTSSRFSD